MTDSFSFLSLWPFFWDVFIHIIVVVASLSLGSFRWYHMLICHFISVHVCVHAICLFWPCWRHTLAASLLSCPSCNLLFFPPNILLFPPFLFVLFFLPLPFLTLPFLRPYFAAPHLLLSLPPPVTRQHWDEGGGDPEEPERLAAGA